MFTTFRLQEVEPAWTRYLILTFRYSALSDEKREGILRLGLNLANGAILDGLLDKLWARLADTPEVAATTAATDLPAPWERQRLTKVLARAVPPRIQHSLVPFLAGLQRRLTRDHARLHAYHHELRSEAVKRLNGLCQVADPSDRQTTVMDRERQRVTSIAREYQAKVADLRQKYAMSVTVEWRQEDRIIVLRGDNPRGSPMLIDSSRDFSIQGIVRQIVCREL